VTSVVDVVNFAFRLQSLARPNRLLVGSETALGIARRIPISDLGLQDLPGRSESLRIYEFERSKKKIAEQKPNNLLFLPMVVLSLPRL